MSKSDAVKPFSDQPLAYARIPVRSPEASTRFAIDVLGLERSDQKEFAFRSDDRRRSIMFTARLRRWPSVSRWLTRRRWSGRPRCYRHGKSLSLSSTGRHAGPGLSGGLFQ